MNKVMRTFTMTGLAVAAGLTMAAGPAAAATAAPAAKGSAVQVQDRFDHRDKTVGYYRTVRACVRAGKIGEFRNKWDDFECERVKRGFKRGWVALEVSWDRKGNWHHGPKGHGPKGHGPHGHR